MSCLTPSATDADSFECADLLQPRLDADNDDSAELVHTVFGALMADDGDVASGWKQKSQSPLADVTPAALLAEHYGHLAASAQETMIQARCP